MIDKKLNRGIFILFISSMLSAFGCTDAKNNTDTNNIADTDSDFDTNSSDADTDSNFDIGSDSDIDTDSGISNLPKGQAIYFVSPSGNDNNPGTIDDPFLTLTKARDAVRTINNDMTGDIYVYLRGGDYRITDTVSFTTQDSGTNGFKIFYKAYPEEIPILNGSVPVTNWEYHSDGIYKASLKRSYKLRNLYVNDQRAFMTSKKITSIGGYGTNSITAGEADWAWTSGTNSDGAQYSIWDMPEVASNRDDLEIVNGTTWNENIVCVRDVITTFENNRALLFQQPYGSIAQLPGWGAGFSVNGTHTVYNAYEFLDSPGEFYFDKSTQTLYYYPRQNEDMSTGKVEAPFIEKLLDISGVSNNDRIHDITFQGIIFANTDYNLYQVGDSHGKATCQGSTIYRAYGDGNWHNSKYEITDTPPGMINVNSAKSIDFLDNVVKHSGSEGISMINDVINSNITGNLITDIAGSGLTIGSPQHIYIGDGGEHALYAPGVEG
ncbi:MAG: hypothetical protein JXR91_11100, partial [Deltaproteobacteria bacterium]|nr:hypothetical protein [Deltaproteobacteria bacterium]